VLNIEARGWPTKTPFLSLNPDCETLLPHE
jgi:hypothetical protein